MKNFSILFLFFISFSAIAQERIDFENWQFREVGTEQWYPATVPGGIHFNLQQNGLIPDPYYGNNEAEVQWVEERDWEFRATVDILEGIANGDAVLYLKAAGLDTYTEIYLNGVKVYASNNAFCNVEQLWFTQKLAEQQFISECPSSYYLDDKLILYEGSHELKIVFHSPLKVNQGIAEQYLHDLPSGNETTDVQVSSFTRKPTFQFGWDWGPRLVGCGILNDIYLKVKKPQHVHFSEIKCDSLTDDEAYMNLNLIFHGFEDWGDPKVPLEQKIFSFGDTINDMHVRFMGQNFQLREGAPFLSLNTDFQIPNPSLWWPNGHGEPHLYHETVELWRGNSLVASKPVTFGIRTVELVNQPDERGTSFYFVVNGKPIYMKGANYIPQHLDPSRVTDVQYEHLIGMAKDANMNMLRVWGGGIYEKDIFYDLCDKNGIMVWQDFMFANSLYPQHEEFKKSWREEVVFQTQRLSKHPCIALFCGNNEIDVAWHNWGWQKQYGYSPEDSAKIYHDYQRQFEVEMPRIVSNLAPELDYVPTSPLSNWGTPENFNHSSMHYWGVWHGKEPFQNYWTNVPRFMAEYGFQSFPNYDLLSQYVDAEDMHIDSEVMKARQKSYIGNGMITQHMERWFEPATDFKDYVEKSQKTQAIGMQMAIMAHRLGQPHCMGTLFWQLNDCWPGPSWSVINFDGTPKVAYETVKTWYAPVVVVPQHEGKNKVNFTIISDGSAGFEGELRVSCGKRKISEKVKLKAGDQLLSSELLKWSKNEQNLQVELWNEEGLVWSSRVSKAMLKAQE